MRPKKRQKENRGRAPPAQNTTAPPCARDHGATGQAAWPPLASHDSTWSRLKVVGADGTGRDKILANL